MSSFCKEVVLNQDLLRLQILYNKPCLTTSTPRSLGRLVGPKPLLCGSSKEKLRPCAAMKPPSVEGSFSSRSNLRPRSGVHRPPYLVQGSRVCCAVHGRSRYHFVSDIGFGGLLRTLNCTAASSTLQITPGMRFEIICGGWEWYAMQNRGGT